MNSVLLETSLSFTKHFETLKKIKYENEKSNTRNL
jgi:hypothetical protein